MIQKFPPSSQQSCSLPYNFIKEPEKEREARRENNHQKQEFHGRQVKRQAKFSRLCNTLALTCHLLSDLIVEDDQFLYRQREPKIEDTIISMGNTS